MRKLLLMLFFISCFAAESLAQFVVNSTYQPMSYDELLAPYVAVAQFQKQCLASLNKIAENTEQVESLLNKDKDPIAWEEYSDCYNSIVNAYNNICNRGTNQQTREVLYQSLTDGAIRFVPELELHITDVLSWLMTNTQDYRVSQD